MNVADLDPKKMPRHIAIIMDGNGRWAKKEGVPRVRGHEAGAASVRAITEACRETPGIQSLSLYAFSTENWRRSKTEVSALFRLLSKYIKLEVDNLHAEDIRVEFMGRRDGLSKRLLAEMDESVERTKNNKSMTLNLAVNYGSRAELVDATRAIAQKAKDGTLKPDTIDESTIAQHLYLPELAEIDLLIRTSGEMRLSNFMLWQLSYAELVVTNTLWPDFRKRHLFNAIREYQSRNRNFGGRKK